MGYFWLNQRSEYGGYDDVIGEQYHYRSNVPGYKLLSEGDLFVYYRPGEHVFFGAGRIERIESRPINGGHSDSDLAEYFASIDQYEPFDPPVNARSIKNEISFLRNKPGLRGVPQNSIYEIDYSDYREIVLAGASEGILDFD